jgi:hypothetical protein
MSATGMRLYRISRSMTAEIAERTRNLLNIPSKPRAYERRRLVVRLRRLTHFDGRDTQEASPRLADRAHAGMCLYLVNLYGHTGYLTASAERGRSTQARRPATGRGRRPASLARGDVEK